MASLKIAQTLPNIWATYIGKKLCCLAESPSLVVMGVDSYFEGRVLESLYTVHWMDIFSHVYVLSCLFEKAKRYIKEAGDGPFKNQQLFHTCNADLLSSETFML